MIGADQRLTPGGSRVEIKPLSKSLGVAPPRYISDATTQSAQNNIMARGYRTNRLQAGRGFSNSAGTRYAQGLQDSDALGQASTHAAQLAANDQAQNAAMKTQHQQMQDMERQRRLQNDLQIQEALMSRKHADKNRDFNRQSRHLQNKQGFNYSLLGGLL